MLYMKNIIYYQSSTGIPKKVLHPEPFKNTGA
jgi:hypothetical protein